MFGTLGAVVCAVLEIEKSSLFGEKEWNIPRRLKTKSLWEVSQHLSFTVGPVHKVERIE